MKKFAITIAALFLLTLGIQAQCTKKVSYSSSKTEFLDSSGKLVDSKAEDMVLTTSKDEIIVSDNNGETQLSGKIKEKTCDWKVPFKEGKTVIKSELADRSGDIKNATITIEGKDGKITIKVEAVEHPDRKIRLVVEKYEEKA